MLAQGNPAADGYFYRVSLLGFAPGSTVPVSCRDSVDAGGFKTFNLITDADGAAHSENGCYSGDGAEHWFTADGVESNHVVWGTPTTRTADPHGSVTLTQGTRAEFGYWYVVRLAGFPPGQAVAVICRDSVTPQGFKSLTLLPDATGHASTERACFSGDGPDHWVTANSMVSNKVVWVPPTTPSHATTPPSAGKVVLSQGAAATHGYWYVVKLTGYLPHSSVQIICRDSVDPGGFKTFTVNVNASGAATNPQACYSGDGPEHWVTADGTSSNTVQWTKPKGTVTLSQGAAAIHGFWYVVHLSGFAPNSAVEVICHDSVDPGGFKTFSMAVDGTGTASTTQACYSGDGPDHWVTTNSVASNHVSWSGLSI